jgi:flagellar hook-length control protein FliK
VIKVNSLPINPIDILPAPDRTKTADAPRKINDNHEPTKQKDRSFEAVLKDVETPKEDVVEQPKPETDNEIQETDDLETLAFNLLNAAVQDPELNLLGANVEPTTPEAEVAPQSITDAISLLASDLVAPTTEDVTVVIDPAVETIEVLPVETVSTEQTPISQNLDTPDEFAPVQTEAIAPTANTSERSNVVEVDATSEIEQLDAASDEGIEDGLLQDGLSQDGQSGEGDGETLSESVTETVSNLETTERAQSEVTRAPRIVNEQPATSSAVESREAVNLAQNIADSATFNPAANSIARSVNANQFLPGPATLQAANAIQTKFTSFVDEPRQTISVELHPPELGRLQITVEQSSDHVIAQIVATEFNSTELLLQEKDFLQEALSDLGFGETTVDISHGGSEQNDPDQDEQSPVPKQYRTSQSETETTFTVRSGSSGVNFLA